jgi:signal transduction histidine kinase
LVGPALVLRAYARISRQADAPTVAAPYVPSMTPTRLLAWAPLAAYVAVCAVTIVVLLNDGDAGPMPILLFLGMFLLASARPMTEVVVGVILFEIGLVVLLVGDIEGFDATDMVVTGIAFIAAAAMGWGLQTRRRRIEGLEIEQAHIREQAAADERLRIAQELHDVVAHSLGVIAVQAGVGLHVMDREPEEARTALEHISRMSRSSLTEIRWLLGRVRDTDGVAYAPAPGLSDLRRLVDEVGRAGLAVDLEVDGTLDQVPPGVGLATYRIAQEALTNAVRHAHARQAHLRVRVEADLVAVEVTDDGRGGTPGTGGHGLVGMQERAAVYGGTVEAGPGRQGGFRVCARLPYGEGAS